MKFIVSALALISLAFPPVIHACEGDCITGITDAFLSNYSLPVHHVLAQLGSQIAEMVSSFAHGDAHKPSHSLAYFKPILAEYEKTSQESMAEAIFPSYFHGKCQQNGVNPPGCPNPDCPVVCGTPGSMVHFYTKLKSLAFEETRDHISALLAPESPQYKETEELVAKAAGGETQSRTQLREIVGTFASRLGEECGGSDKLSHCSWRDEMSEFILTFP